MTKSIEANILSGNSAGLDTFSACIHAVLKHWGRDFDYFYIAGLSGNVFAPSFNENESCTAWWTESGNDHRIVFMGKALGFDVKSSPEISADEVSEGSKFPPEIEKFLREAKEMSLKGRAVIVNAWPCWSIVTGWSDDHTNPELACFKDVAENCRLMPTSRIHILNDAPAQITRSEAIKEALKFGAEIATGQFSREGFSYGNAIFEKIRVIIDYKYLCSVCGANGCNCAYRTMVKLQGIFQTAVVFLEHAGEFLGKTIPQTGLEAVLRGYNSLAEIAKNYIDKSPKCENWDDLNFREHFRLNIVKMSETHSMTARLLSNMVDYF